MFEIGSTLREARQRRGYDIARCEQGTKIRGKYLRAMEEEQFDVLPAPTYVRGFLRSYAEFLELDWQLVLDEYESRFGALESHDADGEGSLSRRRASAAPPPRSPESRVLWIATVVVLLAALVVWVGFGESSDTRGDSSPASPPAAAAALSLRVQGVGSGTQFAVRDVNDRGELLFVGRLQRGQSKTFPFRTTIWVQAEDPTGVKVTVDGKERLLVSPKGYLITREGLRASGASSGGG